MASNRQMNHIRNKAKAAEDQAKPLWFQAFWVYLPWVIFGIVLWVIEHA